MKQIPINEATAGQLRAFAESTLGLSIHPNCNRDAILAKVKQAWDKPEIPVEEPPEAEPQTGQPPRPATAEQQPPKAEMVRILIHVTEDAGGDEPVPVSVNGRAMLIPRGKEVDIKPEYYEVLKNAVQHRYEALPDGGMNPVPRKVPLYPFQRVN